MKTSFSAYKAGLAIFSMFFGAGNIIFPLIIGNSLSGGFSYSLSGFLITAIGMPFLGLFTLFAFSGNTMQFFSVLGRKKGLILACFILLILGPIGSSPRCLTLAYATLSLSFPEISPFAFYLVSSFLLFFTVFKKEKVLPLLGGLLSPLKLSFLAIIIVWGLLRAPKPSSPQEVNAITSFLQGAFQGYNTMDLLASFFFAPLIIASFSKEDPLTQKKLFTKASFLGASLLSLIYVGFAVLSHLYAEKLQGIAPEALLATLSLYILGSKGSFFFSITIAVSCFITAVALIAAFTHFVHEELLQKRISYKTILFFSLLATFFFSNLNFRGISSFLTPLLQGIYPLLIFLTLYGLRSLRKEKKTSLNKVSKY